MAWEMWQLSSYMTRMGAGAWAWLRVMTWPKTMLDLCNATMQPETETETETHFG